MTRFITLTAVLLPFLEIPGFVLVASWIGVIPMLILVLGGVIAGIMVLQRVGINAVVSLRLALAKGEEPGHTLINAACFALGGFLLTIPGFISDIIALILFLPWTRDYLLRRMARHFELRGTVFTGFGARPGAGGPGSRTQGGGTILDGEYSVVEDEPESGAETRSKLAPSEPREAEGPVSEASRSEESEPDQSGTEESASRRRRGAGR
jgi:UPF0716 protein FxsA